MVPPGSERTTSSSPPGSTPSTTQPRASSPEAPRSSRLPRFRTSLRPVPAFARRKTEFTTTETGWSFGRRDGDGEKSILEPEKVSGTENGFLRQFARYRFLIPYLPHLICLSESISEAISLTTASLVPSAAYPKVAPSNATIDEPGVFLRFLSSRSAEKSEDITPNGRMAAPSLPSRAAGPPLIPGNTGIDVSMHGPLQRMCPRGCTSVTRPHLRTSRLLTVNSCGLLPSCKPSEVSMSANPMRATSSSMTGAESDRRKRPLKKLASLFSMT